MTYRDIFSKYQLGFVFILSLFCILIQIQFLERKTPYADNVMYLQNAVTVHDTGVFTAGSHMTLGTPNGEGMWLPPLYIGFIHSLFFLDDTLLETARCSAEHIKPHIIDENCTVDYEFLVYAQSIMGTLSCVFIWLTAILLFQQKRLAWLSVGLVLSAGTLADSATWIMAESLILVLFFAAMYFFIACLKEPKILYTALCGVCIGLLLLTKPAFLYALYFTAFIFAIVGLYRLFTQKDVRVFQHLITVFVCVAIIVGPWIYRNYTQIGYAKITYGYAAFTLPQRLAYNEMTWKEWWVSWIYGIPGEGDSIAEKLFEEENYIRWTYDHPDSFYIQGNRVLRPQTLEEAGGLDNHLSHLMKHYLLPDLPWHTMTTLPIVFRGMWVFEYWVFIPYITFLFLLLHCYRERKYDYVLYAMVPWFMLGLHGFASVNVPRYNIPLQGCLAMALAWAMLCGWDKYKARKAIS